VEEADMGGDGVPLHPLMGVNQAVGLAIEVRGVDLVEVEGNV
jgi:hypothetical protein